MDFRDTSYGLMQGLCENVTSTDDEAWHTDPLYVEVEARASEIEADALERWLDTDRIETLRAMAGRYRERGTVDLPFELEESTETASV